MSGEPAQRKLILYMSMSLDGFAARPDGAIDWLGQSRPHDDRRQRAVSELLGQTGLLVLGRRAAQDMAVAWPSSQSQTGKLMNALPKVVFSSTLNEVEWSNARVSDRPVQIGPMSPAQRGHRMASVICDMSTSVDGYVTGPNDNRENPFGDGAGMLHDWLSDAATDEDRAILQDMIDSVGAVVMGRKSFEKNEGDGGWGESGPLGDTPCFVVTHHAPTSLHPPIYAFVTDGVVSAIDRAKQTAGDKVVSLFGATVMQQALPLGLVDEIRVHVIPVLVGSGTPLFATLDSAISLERTQVSVTPAATHLRFRMVQ